MGKKTDIRINLLIVDHEKKLLIKNLIITLVLISIMGGSLGVIHISALNKLRVEEAFNEELKTNNQKYKDWQNVLKENQALQAKLDTKNDHVKKISAQKLTFTKVFYDIASSVTADIKIIYIDVSVGKVVITGFAKEYNQVAHLLSGLRQAPTIRDVKLISSQQTKSGDEIVFKIETEWEDSAQ